MYLDKSSRLQSRTPFSSGAGTDAAAADRDGKSTVTEEVWPALAVADPGEF